MTTAQAEGWGRVFSKFINTPAFSYDPSMAKPRKKSPKTRKFLAVYLGTKASMKKWEKLPSKERNERETRGMAAWQAWAAEHKKSIVDLGAPLGTTKLVNRKGIRPTSNALSVYTIVRAPSHAAAAKIFKNHPHFMIFPGDSIEVMECLDIPGM